VPDDVITVAAEMVPHMILLDGTPAPYQVGGDGTAHTDSADVASSGSDTAMSSGALEQGAGCYRHRPP
jgi:hypothetical protein